LESLAFELSMRDYEVLQASDGQMALDLLQTADPLPDIIVSDIAMPDIDGYRLLEEVRAQEVWAAIPIILLTAFDSANAVRIGKDLGADDYLIKPVDPDDLIVAMENKLTRVKQIERHVEKNLDETRHELLSMISHELRSPLTSIHGSTEVLADRLNDVPDALTTKMLDILRMGSYRMNRLANRIVSMVQIERGYLQDQLANHSESLKSNDVLNAALDEIRKLHPTFNRIEVTLANCPAYVRGNGGYLH